MWGTWIFLPADVWTPVLGIAAVVGASVSIGTIVERYYNGKHTKRVNRRSTFDAMHRALFGKEAVIVNGQVLEPKEPGIVELFPKLVEKVDHVAERLDEMVETK